MLFHALVVYADADVKLQQTPPPVSQPVRQTSAKKMSFQNNNKKNFQEDSRA